MALIDLNNIQRMLDSFYSKIKNNFAPKNHGTHLTLGISSATAFRGDYGNTAYNHSQAPHAPSNAQKNSDITKTEIEAKLTGTITSHSHTIAKITDLRLKNGVSGVTIADPYQTWASADINGNDIIFGGSYNGHTTTDANIVFASGNGKINMVIDGEYYAAEGKQRVYHTGYKPTPADIGAAKESHGTHLTIGTSASHAAAGNHTHNYAGSSSVGGAANSVKYPLTFRYRGYTTNSYDGSTSRTLDLNAEMIGAAPGGYSEITTGDTKGWYRIALAPSGFGSVLGDFIITAYVSNVRSNIKITAGVSQTTRPLLQQLGSTYNVTGLGCITKVRIVYDNTYTGAGAYLEVYSDFDGPVTLYVQLFGGNVGGGSIGNDMQYYSRWHLYSGTSTVQVDNPGTNYRIKELTLKELKMIADFEGTFNGFRFWSGTQSQYDAIATKDPTTVYMITD